MKPRKMQVKTPDPERFSKELLRFCRQFQMHRTAGREDRQKLGFLRGE